MGIHEESEEAVKFDVEASRAEALKAIDTGEPEYAAVEVSRLFGLALDEITRLMSIAAQVPALLKEIERLREGIETLRVCAASEVEGVAALTLGDAK